MKTLKIVLFLIFLFITGFMNYLTLTEGHNWGGDFSSYIMQAKSLVHGTTKDFVKSSKFTVENSTHPISPIAYPWGFPMLLAPVYALYGLNLIPLKIPGLLCFELFLIVGFYLFRTRVSFTGVLLILSFCAFNPAIVTYHDNIVSDIPFLFLSTFSIFLIDKIIMSDTRFISKAADPILVGLSIFMASFVRTNGIILFPLVFICQTIQLLTKRRRPSLHRNFWDFYAFALPHISFALLYFLAWLSFPKDEISRITLLYECATSTLAENTWQILRLPAVFFSQLPIERSILYGISCIFCILGVRQTIKRDYHFLLYIVFTMTLYSLWGGWDIRYLFPILPFYSYFLYKGLLSVRLGSSRFRKNFGYWLAYCSYGFVLTFFLIFSSTYAYANIYHEKKLAGSFEPVSIEMYRLIKKYTTPDDVIIFFKPRVLRMLTDRKALLISEPASLHKGDYLVLHKSFADYDQVDPAKPESYRNNIYESPMYENAKFIIYKIR